MYITIFLFNNDLATKRYVGVWPNRMFESTSAIWNEHCMNRFFCNKNWGLETTTPVELTQSSKLEYQIECHVIVAWDIHHRIAKRWYVYIPKFKKTYKCRTSQPSTEVKTITIKKNTWATFEKKTSNKRNTKTLVNQNLSKLSVFTSSSWTKRQGTIKGVDWTSTSHSWNATLLGLLVNDANPEAKLNSWISAECCFFSRQNMKGWKPENHHFHEVNLLFYLFLWVYLERLPECPSILHGKWRFSQTNATPFSTGWCCNLRPHSGILVGGFNPFQRYWSNWIISPRIGANYIKKIHKKKHIWKPPPRWQILCASILGTNSNTHRIHVWYI